MNSLAQLSVLHRLTSFSLLSFRPLLKCIQCPMGSKSKHWKARRVAATVASGLPMGKGMEEATTQVMEKKSSRLLAGRGDPSLTKNDRAAVKRRLLRLVSLQSILGHLHQPQLKKRQSIPKLQSRSLGRRCRRLRSTSPLLLRECLPLYSLDAPCCLFFLI